MSEKEEEREGNWARKWGREKEKKEEKEEEEERRKRWRKLCSPNSSDLIPFLLLGPVGASIPPPLLVLQDNNLVFNKSRKDGYHSHVYK